MSLQVSEGGVGRGAAATAGVERCATTGSRVSAGTGLEDEGGLTGAFAAAITRLGALADRRGALATDLGKIGVIASERTGADDGADCGVLTTSAAAGAATTTGGVNGTSLMAVRVDGGATGTAPGWLAAGSGADAAT